MIYKFHLMALKLSIFWVRVVLRWLASSELVFILHHFHYIMLILNEKTQCHMNFNLEVIMSDDIT